MWGLVRDARSGAARTEPAGAGHPALSRDALSRSVPGYAARSRSIPGCTVPLCPGMLCPALSRDVLSRSVPRYAVWRGAVRTVRGALSPRCSPGPRGPSRAPPARSGLLFPALSPLCLRSVPALFPLSPPRSTPLPLYPFRGSDPAPIGWERCARSGLCPRARAEGGHHPAVTQGRREVTNVCV